MDSGREEGSAMLKWVSAFFVVIAIAGLGAYYFVAKPDLSALLDRDEPVVSRSSAPAPDAEPSTAPEEVKEVRYALLIANEDYPSVVGRLKKPWLAGQIGPEAMELNRRVKAALDPDGILNPGALI